MNIQTKRTNFIVAGILLTSLASTGKGIASFWPWYPLVLNSIAILCLLYGGYLWAKIKGRHWIWMFVMFFWPVGLLVFLILKNKFVNNTSQKNKLF